MIILRKINPGHYNKVYEVEYEGEIAIAKFTKSITLFTANAETFFGRIFLDDNRTYSTPAKRQEYEIRRLKTLKETGANVPEIISTGKNYFVMKNIPGNTLEQELKMGRTERIEETVEALRNFHRITGNYHGSPRPRNIILNDNGVYFVDLETQLVGQTLASNQARDLKILAIGIHKFQKK